MRVLLLIILLPAIAGAQALTKPPRIAEEGTLVDPPRWTTNFIGSTITCVDDAANQRTNCTVSAGGGSGNFLETTIAMTGGAGIYSVTVTGQAWVSSSSIIVCTPFGTTADGLTAEQVAVANLDVSIANRVAGVGFDVFINNPTGSHGTHRIHCTGA